MESGKDGYAIIRWKNLFISLGFVESGSKHNWGNYLKNEVSCTGYFFLDHHSCKI